jgi:hypothetical protein
VTDYEPPRPGAAVQEEPEEPEEKPAPGEASRAHYAGMTDADAAEVWRRESICVRCASAAMCRVAQHIEAPLVVVTRCLGYLPTSG